MTDHKDYSGTPLWRKLGIAEGARVHISHAPAAFAGELTRIAPLPVGVTILARPAKDLDVALTFASSHTQLTRRFADLARALAPAGRLWVAWPKQAAGLPTDLGFETVQRVGLDAGLVDNKSASITSEYQGLQFVYRLKDRPR